MHWLPPSAVGPAFALAAAAIWAVSPMLMASAGRKIGSFPVLLLRSVLASLLFAVAVLLQAAVTRRAPILPDRSQVAWLAISGIIGMGVGDILVYEAFVTLGARRTSQVLVLAPAVAATLAWDMLGETLPPRAVLGMIVTLAGTFYAVLAGQPKRAIAAGESGDVTAEGVSSGKARSAEELPADGGSVPVTPQGVSARAAVRHEPGHVTSAGLFIAVGGAVCMAVGAVFVRRAFDANPSMDRMAATFVRVTAAGLLLWAAPVARGQIRQTLAHLRHRHIASRVGLGTFLGPGVGMFCYVAAFQASPAGLVSTLVATTPLFAIPITVLRYRVPIRWDVWLAAALAVGGVGMMVGRG